MARFRVSRAKWIRHALLLVAVGGLVVSVGAPPSALGVGQERVPQAVFGARVELVQIQVQVEDSRGNFVSGLSPSDFRLTVDGQPRNVSIAYEVDLRGDRTANLEPDPTMPPAAWRQFLLFFDLSFTTPRGILAARDAAREFVSTQVHPNDLISVATFNLVSGLRMLCPFTLDRAQALDAVETMGLARAMSITDPAGFAFVPVFEEINSLRRDPGMDLGEASPGTGGGPGAAVDPFEVFRATFADASRADFRRYREEVNEYIDQIGRLGDMLQAVRGRKHVVFFSAGFSDEVLTGQSLEEFAEDSEAIQQNRVWEVDSEKRFGSSDLRQSMQVALDSLRSADAVIHTVDTTGLPGGAEVRGGTYQDAVGGRGALNYLASGTSGTVSWNRNDFSIAMKEIEESTSTFYVIAYALEEDDPKIVELDVQVTTAGARVVSAPSRFAPPPGYAELDPTQQQLQLAEIISKGVEPEGFSFDIEAIPFAGDNDISRVAVVVEVPWLDLQAFAAPRGDNKAEVEILGYTLDDGGAMIDFFSRKVNLDLERMGAMDPANGVPFRYYDMLWAIPGHYHVRVLLRDTKAGNLGTRTVPVLVPKFNSNQLLMSGPIFIDSKRPGLVMRGVDPNDPPDRKQSGPVAYPFIIGEKELTPYVLPSVAPGEACQFYAVTHHLSRDIVSGETQVTITAEAIDLQGNAHVIDNISLVSENYDADSDATMLLLQAQMPGDFPRGTYTLKFTVLDGLSGTQAEGDVPFTIVDN
jgi:VWFA-related protein